MRSALYIAFSAIIFCSCISFTQKEDPVITKTEKTKSSVERDSIIAYAKKYLGTPYVYAGNDPKKGFDCSGFVSYVFKNFNVTLPRSSNSYKDLGVALDPEDFKVGDILVFYGYKDRTIVGHLGIICEANGMHSKFIHASSGKVNSVTITDLDTEHYTKRFYKCIDVLSK
ncbi:MAG: NlpC/P60 family protein [Flavobacterium sp.]|nr:MAG: NlpC/P60 family protein [Flavobacterium sp.]